MSSDGDFFHRMIPLDLFNNIIEYKLQMDDKKVKEEQAKQKALMAGLERQYEVSREFSHQGRGKGLGFGGY